MNKAELVSKELNMIEGRSYWYQNNISNDDLINELQAEAIKCYHNGDDELFVFEDGSCINRTGDEYFVNNNVELLDLDYLEMIGYL